MGITYKFAVIADVHGNYEALKKSIAILRKRNVDNIFFLGDAIGYGADPEKCFEVLKKDCVIMLMGNHEAMMIDSDQKMSSLCKESFDWTRKRIGHQMKKEMENLPFYLKHRQMAFFHAAPDNTLKSWRYLNDTDDIISAFDTYERICFYGHTHRPRVTVVGDDALDEYIHKTKEYHIDIKKNRCYINPGSIGQQRDDKTDMSFCVCSLTNDILKVTIERHRYNFLKAYMKIRYMGCGINNANYMIREKWRRKLYEGFGNRCGGIYRKICLQGFRRF
ncbi:MAG: metallophosphoesterase family protein [Lachnospiraceae bacterium]|nr:metallophosphoesterase family protein [Lachnospiraceae bacterium]